MPRYSLILSDEKYVKLLRIAAMEGKTLGKKLSEIVDEFLRKYEEEIKSKEQKNE